MVQIMVHEADGFVAHFVKTFDDLTYNRSPIGKQVDQSGDGLLRLYGDDMCALIGHFLKI